MDDGIGGKYSYADLSDAEKALFIQFIDKLRDGRYDECRQICGLLERLSII